MKKIAVLFTLMVLSFPVTVFAHAENFDVKSFYLGGGFSFNNLPGVGSARGYQFLAGYQFDFRINDDITTALEVGYMNSGDFDRINTNLNAEEAKGVWASVLESVPLSKKTDMLVRLGYDFGDDDGLLLGTGLQYRIDTRSSFRMEYVAREHVNGLQANILFKF